MNAHALLMDLLKTSEEARAFVRQRLLGRSGEPRDYTAIDPVDCGCTDCAVGRTRPAHDREEELLALAAGCARGFSS